MDSCDPATETQLPTRKRRENLTAVACSPCRHAKLKCDGGKPICRTCDRRSRACYYDVEKSKYQSLLEKFQEAQHLIKETEDSRKALCEVLRVLASAKELPQHEHLFDADQQWPDNSNFTLGTSIVLPAGWVELSRLFRIHYASDLSFLHIPTLIDPYILAAEQSCHGHTGGRSLAQEAQTPRTTALILAFLALTLRHCRNRLRDYLVPRVHDVDNASFLSEYFAVLANRFLVVFPTDRSRSNLEGVQVRLMLACYDWSMSRCRQARHLLLEAISMACDLGLHQEHRTQSATGSMSVAMAFEADSMGLGMRLPGRRGESPDVGVPVEAARRTTWCCYLLDTQYSCGENRIKLMSDTDNFPPLPRGEAALAGKVQTEYFPDCAPSNFSQTQHDSDFSILPRAPSVGSMPNYKFSISPHCNALSYYIRYVSLFHRIQKWAHSRPWSEEKHPPWTKSCSWNALLRQLLVINKSLPADLQLTKSNTIYHASQPTAAQYFNMHIARLQCQMTLHWETMPFLPLRLAEADGPQRLKSLFRESTAPSGFWKSSAREFFGASRTVLDLAADAREVGALPMNSFALYVIFCAKFVEVYAKAFNWMDPDRVPRDEYRSMDANHGMRATCLSYRPHISYVTEIEGITDTLPIAEQWVDVLESVTNYFDTFKQDYAASVALGRSRPTVPGTAGLQVPRSLRDGGQGEGEEEFELFRHLLGDYGIL